MQFAKIDVITVHVSVKTKWVFLKVVSGDGLIGYGEATNPGWETALQSFAKVAKSRILMKEIQSPSDIYSALPDKSGGLILASVLSALEQAFWDIRGQELGKPIHKLWGTCQSEVLFYANINRGTEDRTEKGWVEKAEAARRAGFSAIKLAPFDGVKIIDKASKEQLRLVDDTLSKIAAVTQAVGDDMRIMVDCHWRLNEEVADYVLSETSAMGIHWLEAPLPENYQNLDAIARLNRRAAKAGVRLAGVEIQNGINEFLPYIDNQAYDTLMPDLRWCGGPEEGLRIAELAKKENIDIAPHNSAGPLLSATSLHYACAIDNLYMVEIQFDESPLYFSILKENYIHIGEPKLSCPTTPGLGLTLNEKYIASLPTGDTEWAQVFDQPGSSCFS